MMPGRVALVSIRKRVDKHYFLKKWGNFKYLIYYLQVFILCAWEILKIAGTMKTEV